MLACLLYFGVDLLSPVIYDNRADGWVPIAASAHFLLLPFVFAAFVPVKIDPIKIFIRGVQIGAIIGGVIAVIQTWAGIDRAIGGMINSFPFGATAASFACLSLIGAGDADTKGRVLAAAAFSSGLAATILSEARGAWLALPILLIILLLYMRTRYGRRFALWATVGLAVIGVTVAVAARDSIRERLDETFVAFQGFNFGHTDRTQADAFSLDQRALMMAYGLEAIADRPILGYGPQNAVDEVRARAAADGYEIDKFGHLHNEFLTETVGNGVVGLATLLLLLAAPVVTAYRSARDGRFADRMAIAAIISAGSALFGLTSLAFGHDITNSVYVSALLVVCLSAAASGPRVRKA
jgi:O-antigen ligase